MIDDGPDDSDAMRPLRTGEADGRDPSMTTFTIELPEEHVRRLHDLAREAGTTPEDLIRAGIEEWLAHPRADFAEAAEYVLEKNAELYRRLA
jgi:predicted transcriptional regulator